MPPRRGSKATSRGWAAIDNPVPGDVLKCLEELGIRVHKITGEGATAEALALCPGHEQVTGHADRKPSWSVNLDTGLHGCWSCGWRGNFPRLVRFILDVDHADAATWIRARGALDFVRRRLTPVTPVERPQVTEAALALFTAPPPGACAERLLDVDACRRLGVLWDPARDMWILPIRDPHTHQLLGYQEKNKKWFRNKPETMKKAGSLFGLDIFPGGTAVLMESPLDVARLMSCGIQGGLASYGVRVSDTQLALVIDRAEDLIVALDNDPDGHAATLELLHKAAGRIPMRVWNYTSEAKDPGEQSADELARSYRTAVGGLAYRLDRTGC